MTVRDGGPADHEAIRGLFEAYFVELWERPWQPRPPDDAWLDGKLLLIAEDDGEAVGCGVASVAPGAAWGHVHLVYVRPDRRRAGIGRELLRETAARVRAAGG